MEKETIWRLQEEDFRVVMEDNFPHLTEKQKDEIIEIARQKFNIHDWYEYVETWIGFMLDDVSQPVIDNRDVMEYDSEKEEIQHEKSDIRRLNQS